MKDSTEVPYYLEKEYRDKNVKNDKGEMYGKIVYPYHIYTRVVDNNTSINKQADINDIEFLWRKRFGIDLSIMDRLNILLNDIGKWIFDWGNKKYCYHSDFPEFQIVQVEDMKQGWMPVAAFYTHPVMYLAKLNIIYHNTTIYESELWSFDEFRKYLPGAQSCDISSREPNYHQILVFENENEKKRFDNYILEHFDDHNDNEINDKYRFQLQEDNEENFGGILYSAYQVAKTAWLYEDWMNYELRKEIPLLERSI